MALATYMIALFVAALASLAGLTAVWIPLAIVAGVVLVRAELLVLLGLLAGLKPVSKLDSAVLPDPDPA